MMKKILLFTAIAATATILTATDSFAYSNECVTLGNAVTCYDANGHQTSLKSYDGDPENGGRVASAQTWNYDSNGNLTLVKFYNGDPEDSGSLSYAVTDFTYDSNGNTTSYKFYVLNPDGGGWVYRYACDNVCNATSIETITAEQWQAFVKSISPKAKRTFYTIEEAMQHVNHSDNNKIIFTFK